MHKAAEEPSGTIDCHQPKWHSPCWLILPLERPILLCLLQQIVARRMCTAVHSDGRHYHGYFVIFRPWDRLTLLVVINLDCLYSKTGLSTDVSSIRVLIVCCAAAALGGELVFETSFFILALYTTAPLLQRWGASLCVLCWNKEGDTEQGVGGDSASFMVLPF